jgi:hypothetical protein
MFCLALVVGVIACKGSGDDATPGVAVDMQFDRAAFYSAPFPSDDLRRADGTIDLSKFPNPNGVDLIQQAVNLIQKDARGFATSAAIFFRLTGAIDRGKLPTLAQSQQKGASVFLVSVDASSDDLLHRYPIQVAFEEDAGPFGDLNVLSLLPLQGIPLKPATKYAAVVTTAVAPRVSAEMAQIVGNQRPAAMPQNVFDEHEAALDALKKDGLDASTIAGMTVFTTDAPTVQLDTVVADLKAHDAPAIDAPFAKDETFDDYCVYSTTITMPDYQAGTPPFNAAKDGGAWAFDASGKPVVQRNEKANLVVTVPRATIPDSGFPLVVFVRTGGGGDRPLVDRGVQATNGGPPITPGSGPAHDFAQVGFAGIQVDGPHGGLRNVSHQDEQFVMFNVANAAALRDNVRESAVELTLMPRIAKSLSIDVHDCPGAQTASGKTIATFDLDHLALMGHSMGATISPLVLAGDATFKSAILSGAGASWIENVMYKLHPVEVQGLIAGFLGYGSDRTLSDHDPALTLFQWGAEPADPMVYDARVVHAPKSGESPRNVLMLQGIVDHYIMPPIANATSLSLGLDLAGPPYDATAAETSVLPTIESMLVFSGRNAITLPASGNVTAGGASFTDLVIQHPEDGIEDGHEVVFQTEPPKHQYRCFLQSWLKTGVPSVPPDGKEEDACP